MTGALEVWKAEKLSEQICFLDTYTKQHELFYEAQNVEMRQKLRGGRETLLRFPWQPWQRLRSDEIRGESVADADVPEVRQRPSSQMPTLMRSLHSHGELVYSVEMCKLRRGVAHQHRSLAVCKNHLKALKVNTGLSQTWLTMLSPPEAHVRVQWQPCHRHYPERDSGRFCVDVFGVPWHLSRQIGATDLLASTPPPRRSSICEHLTKKAAQLGLQTSVVSQGTAFVLTGTHDIMPDPHTASEEDLAPLLAEARAENPEEEEDLLKGLARWKFTLEQRQRYLPALPRPGYGNDLPFYSALQPLLPCTCKFYDQPPPQSPRPNKLQEISHLLKAGSFETGSAEQYREEARRISVIKSLTWSVEMPVLLWQIEADWDSDLMCWAVAVPDTLRDAVHQDLDARFFFAPVEGWKPPEELHYDLDSSFADETFQKLLRHQGAEPAPLAFLPLRGWQLVEDPIFPRQKRRCRRRLRGLRLGRCLRRQGLLHRRLRLGMLGGCRYWWRVGRKGLGLFSVGKGSIEDAPFDIRWWEQSLRQYTDEHELTPLAFKPLQSWEWPVEDSMFPRRVRRIGRRLRGLRLGRCLRRKGLLQRRLRLGMLGGCRYWWRVGRKGLGLFSVGKGSIEDAPFDIRWWEQSLRQYTDEHELTPLAFKPLQSWEWPVEDHRVSHTLALESVAFVLVDAFGAMDFFIVGFDLARSEVVGSIEDAPFDIRWWEQSLRRDLATSTETATPWSSELALQAWAELPADVIADSDEWSEEEITRREDRMGVGVGCLGWGGVGGAERRKDRGLIWDTIPEDYTRDVALKNLQKRREEYRKERRDAFDAMAKIGEKLTQWPEQGRWPVKPAPEMFQARFRLVLARLQQRRCCRKCEVRVGTTSALSRLAWKVEQRYPLRKTAKTACADPESSDNQKSQQVEKEHKPRNRLALKVKQRYPLRKTAKTAEVDREDEASEETPNDEKKVRVRKLVKIEQRYPLRPVSLEDRTQGTPRPILLQQAQEMFEDDQTDIEELRRSLGEGHARLVRGSYLRKLWQQGRPWPRRQEAEEEEARLGKGSIFLDSTVLLQCLKTWDAADIEQMRAQPLIVAVSHVWESKQHPDPYRHQLKAIVSWMDRNPPPDATRDVNQVMKIFKWRGFPSNEYFFFIDYLSLNQYRRFYLQEVGFRQALGNIQVFYSHSLTRTWRVETLTDPEEASRQVDTGLQVCVFDKPSDTVRPVPVGDLEANTIPYRRRGWCFAELQWSRNRWKSELTVAIDEGSETAEYDGWAPPSAAVARAHFAKSGLTFTYSGDTEVVIARIDEVFAKSKEKCRLKVLRLPSEEVEMLALSLGDFSRLRSLTLQSCQLEAACSETLAHALSTSSVRELRVVHCKGAVTLLEAIKHSTTLAALSVDGEPGHFIGDHGAKVLASMVDRQKSVLTEIRLDGSGIGDAGTEALAKSASKSSVLRILSLCRNCIGDVGAQALAENCWDLQEVMLDDNHIGDTGAEALAKLASKSLALRVLSLCRNDVGDGGAEAFTKMIRSSSSFKRILLKSNANITDAVWQEFLLASWLAEHSPGLACLDLNSRPVGDAGAEAIAAAIAGSVSLKIIALSGSGIGDTGAKEIADVAKGLSRLYQVGLANNCICDCGTQALAAAVMMSTSLRALGLRGNSVGDEGATALAAAAKTSKQLRILDLRENGIGDEGAAALAEAAKTSKSLRTVDLRDNRIGDAGAKAFFSATWCMSSSTQTLLDGNHTSHAGTKVSAALWAITCRRRASKQTLDLCYANVDDAVMKAIVEYLEDFSFRDLLLQGNRISDQGVKVVAASAAFGTSVKRLKLASNRVGDIGAQALAKAFLTSEVILEADLKNNRVGDKGAQALLEALLQCSSLKRICLDGAKSSVVPVVHAVSEVKCYGCWLNLRQRKLACVGAKALVRAVSGLPALEGVVLEDIEMPASAAKAVARTIGAHPKLQRLDIRSCKFRDLHVQAIAEATTEQHNLEEMSLRNNEIGDLGAQAVAQAIKRLPRLERVNLEDNAIGDSGAKAIAEAVKDHSELKELSLRNNKMGDLGAQAFLEAVLESTSFPETFLDCSSSKVALVVEAAWHTKFGRTSCWRLDLKQKHLDDVAAEAVAQAIKRLPRLERVNLEENEIGDSGAKAIAEAVKDHSKLEELSLRKNKIGNGAVQALAEAVRMNASLKTVASKEGEEIDHQASTALSVLDLRETGMGDAGAQAFLEAVLESTSFPKTFLDCSSSKVALVAEAAWHTKFGRSWRMDLEQKNLDDVAAEAVAQAIKRLPRLEAVYLEGNEIGDSGAEAIAEAVKDHSKLKAFLEAVLESTSFPETVLDCPTSKVAAVAQAAWNIKFGSARSIELEEMDLDDPATQAVARAITGLPMLESVYLKDNKIGDSGAQAIAEAIMEHPTLAVVSLRNNRIGEIGAQAFAEVEKHPRFRKNLPENALREVGAQDEECSEKQEEQEEEITG
ncbi:NLRC3 [Symbiodinium sp. CCMP2592]|nr:NLRC3 [Symbiodinium sp. CCMP2592]